METVNNVATNVVSTASKLIWGEGENTEEPLSGQKGTGTATDPYDKGNDETLNSTAGTGSTTSNTLGSSTHHTSGPGGTDLAGSKNSGSGTTGSDITGSNTTGSGTVGSGTTSSNFIGSNTTGSGIAGSTENNTFGSATPVQNTTNPAESGAVPFQKQQGADRPDEEPSAKQTEAIAEKKNKAEDSLENKEHKNTSHTKITSDEQRNELAEKGDLPHDPNDHSGEPMHMHAGGDPEKPFEGETTKEKTERSASVSHEGGGEHGKEQGTGEKWVKSSGIAAEGGDFDVTKPGAGKEASRLMEEKGIKTEGATLDTTDSPKDTSTGTHSKTSAAHTEEEKAKVSKLAKLKEKLHIGSGKNLD